MSHPGFSRNPAAQQEDFGSPKLCLEQVCLQATLGIDFLLRDISLMIQPGEIVAVVGASGSGKTSLLRLLNGLVTPSTGKISLNGQPFASYAPVELRLRLVSVPQEPKLLGMNVQAALGYPLLLQGRTTTEIQTQIEYGIDLLRIPREWLSKTELQLSLGQRQLVAIARALIMQPEVILLDEPTSALDLGSANHLLEVLKQLNQEQNLTIIMVNHQLDLLENFGDRLLLLEQGLLIADMPATKSNWQTAKEKICRFQSESEQEWL